MVTKNDELSRQIWQVVALIPPGKVATYGDIARHAGLGNAARRVGYALRQLPPGSRIPWHRVINAQGRVSLPPESSSAKRQHERLSTEGVIFSAAQRIDLKRFRWQPGQEPS